MYPQGQPVLPIKKGAVMCLLPWVLRIKKSKVRSNTFSKCFLRNLHGLAKSQYGGHIFCFWTHMPFLSAAYNKSDNTALFGIAHARKRAGKKIITTQVEHPAVMESCKAHHLCYPIVLPGSRTVIQINKHSFLLYAQMIGRRSVFYFGRHRKR